MGDMKPVEVSQDVLDGLKSYSDGDGLWRGSLDGVASERVRGVW